VRGVQFRRYHVAAVLLQEVAGLDDVFEDHRAEAWRRFLERPSVEDFVV
jgi:hypothetical protein